MKSIKFFVFLAAIFSVTVLISKPAFSEEASPAVAQVPKAEAADESAQPQAAGQAQQPETMAAKPMETPGIGSPALTELDTQWVWGEITSLDLQNKQLSISYFDYETDAEKELKLAVDDNTKYENINSANELKLHDTISVDYILSADGRNAARNISLEKPEESIVPVEETTDSASGAAEPKTVTQ